jgi:hypothetical protein
MQSIFEWLKAWALEFGTLLATTAVWYVVGLLLLALFQIAFP